MPENIDILQFLGSMDSDTPFENFEKGYIISAWDIIWKGPQGNRRPQSNVGTTLVPNALLPSGNNITIGTFYDQVGKRLIFFNYNGNGNHGIYVYNTLAKTIQRVIQTNIGTIGDPLGFTPTGRISSVKILYGDAVSGDVLQFIDSLKRPTQINLQRYLSGTYIASPGIIQRDFINVIKAPPVAAPWAVYENDYNVTANNFINSLWHFAEGYGFDNNEKSVLSTGSKMPLPTVSFDPNQAYPTYQNARIALYLQTGDVTVKYLRIYGKQTINGSTTDWLILDVIKKSDYNIPDNSIYRYQFFNNGNYLTEDTNLSNLDFDLVPQQANCMEILDGNTLIYGGITEGYNFINPQNLNITSTNQSSPIFSVNGTLFFAAQTGLSGTQPLITLYLTGAGANDVNGNPTTLIFPPQNLFVRAKSGNTDISFSYVNALQGGVSQILTGLQNAATTAGWAFVASTTNSITLLYPTGNVVLQSSYIQGFSFLSQPYAAPQFALYPQSSYQIGAVYRDLDGGRTNGVTSNYQGQTTTPIYVHGSNNIPELVADLSGFTPPSWANSYRLVRTDTLTYNKYLHWVSDAAYSSTNQSNGLQSAYLGITNIALYNQNIGATQGVISYGFTNGDRVRILGRYDIAGNYTPLNLDYAIKGVATNPVIAGVIKAGTFIQIVYPTNDISVNFKFDGSDNFQNYEILIYSYKSQNPQGQNVFYEIGEWFNIGNPGTPQAYHMGNISDNKVAISDGDVFFRTRNVPLINTYTIGSSYFDQLVSYSTLNLVPNSPINNALIKFNPTQNFQAFQNVTYPPNWSSPDNVSNYILNQSPVPLTIRITYTQQVQDVKDPAGQWQLFGLIYDPANANEQLFPLIPRQTGLSVGAVNNFQIDSTIVLQPNYKFWMISNCVNEQNISGAQITIQVIRTVTLKVFDPSYSDIYSLKTNSDNKPNVIVPTARQIYNGTLLRYSQPREQGTDINATNRFYDANSDFVEGGYGSIQRLILWNRRLRIAQERKWGEKGVYGKFLKNNTGQLELIATNTIIDTNNIFYFEEDSGIGTQQDALISNGFQIWYCDPVRGHIGRLSVDGIKIISEEHRLQTFAGNLLPQYLNVNPYIFGGNAVILASYNFAKDKNREVLFHFQGSTNGLKAQTVSFSERDGFTSYFNYAPDAVVCAENQLISFYNGQLYLHNNSTSYATYYGQSFLPQIEMIFNENELIKKTFQALSFQSYQNKIWTALSAGDITTSFFNNQTNKQQASKLIAALQDVEEGNVRSALLRDINSGPNPQVALTEGEYLKGVWIRILLTAPDNAFNFIQAPFVRWTPSGRVP